MCEPLSIKVGRSRLRRRARPLKVGRPRSGARLYSDGKPLTHEHTDAEGRVFVIKGGRRHYRNLPKDRKIRAKFRRARAEPHWRGDYPATGKT